MESCGMSIIKYTLFVFNLLFAISGIGIIVAGGVVLSDVSDINHFVTSDLLGPPVVLIVAGAIVFIIAFLGCFGAIRESYNILMTFAVLLAIIFILELAAGIAAAVYQNDFKDSLKSTLKASMANYSVNNVEQVAWNNIQKKFKCCGVEGPSDWQGQTFPTSCCHSEISLNDPLSSYCAQNGGNGGYMYNSGCFEKLQTKIESNTKVLIGVGIGIAFVEIVGIILAVWLAYTIKNENGK